MFAYMLHILALYLYKGCFKDTSSHTMSAYIASYTGVDTIDKCYQAAKQRGYQAFGLYSSVECWSGVTAHTTYSIHGDSDGCKDGCGGTWALDVYFIGR